jgi:hypothetical protein
MIKGPYLTLLAGAILAAVLLALDVRATPSENVAQKLGTPAATAATPTASAATPSAGTTPSASSTVTITPPSSAATAASAPPPNAAVHDYAGRVDGGGASVAISIYNGRAIAYVCGGTYEVWFTGTAKDGRLALTGRYGATLTATYDTRSVHGLVVGSGRHWTFTSPTVKAPSGLYRSYTKYKGVKVQATWIVLPDGSQVGAEDAGGDTATAAPVGPIDFSTGDAVLPDGQTVQPARIDGSQEGS